MTAGTSRWERWARPRVLIAAVVAVLVATVSMIVLYSVLLDRMSKQVESAQARSANLSNADREVLVLLQVVTQLGVDTDPHEIDALKSCRTVPMRSAAPSRVTSAAITRLLPASK